MKRDLVYHLNNGIVIRRYSNGSYAFLNEAKRFINIPSELAEILISKYVL
jgi:hypothetical protein